MFITGAERSSRDAVPAGLEHRCLNRRQRPIPCLPKHPRMMLEAAAARAKIAVRKTIGKGIGELIRLIEK